MNPLGDGISESLSTLLSACPLLAKLSLQACSLTARFLQQHRLLLAAALTGDLERQSCFASGFSFSLDAVEVLTLPQREAPPDS